MNPYQAPQTMPFSGARLTRMALEVIEWACFIFGWLGMSFVFPCCLGWSILIGMHMDGTLAWFPLVLVLLCVFSFASHMASMSVQEKLSEFHAELSHQIEIEESENAPS